MSRDTGNMTNVLQGYINSEKRVERMRKLNRLKMVQDEESREEEMMREIADRENYQKQMSRQEALAKQLEKRQIDQLREEKSTQLVREQAPEIRELEQRLQAAYMNKERQGQVEEAKQRHVHEREVDMKQYHETEALRIRAIEAQRDQEAHRTQTLREQKVVLEQQMHDRDLARLEAYKQFLEEKRVVDQIVSRIQAEDKAKLEDKLRKQHVAQMYITQYLEEREHFKQLDEERRKEEDQKIVAFMKEQARRKEENLKTAREKEAMQQKRLEEQSRAIASEQKRKEEMEELIADYHLELVEKKERERAREEMERKIKSRLMMVQANEQQKELKAAQKEQDAEEELKFRTRMMEKFADDDRIEQMKMAERNRKRAEHNREVNRLLAERQTQREAERERELLARAKDEDMENLKRQIIQQERAKLLREHAIKLKDFLPKGVFTEDDLRALGINSIDEL